MNARAGAAALLAVVATLELVNGFHGSWLHFVASALFSAAALGFLWSVQP